MNEPNLLDFGQAVRALRSGERVARRGWNGKGMYLEYVDAPAWAVHGLGLDATRKLPWIGIKTADGAFVPWLASQTDILADDWEAVW